MTMQVVCVVLWDYAHRIVPLHWLCKCERESTECKSVGIVFLYDAHSIEEEAVVGGLFERETRQPNGVFFEEFPTNTNTTPGFFFPVHFSHSLCNKTVKKRSSMRLLPKIENKTVTFKRQVVFD
jgi:hypothetical protein